MFLVVCEFILISQIPNQHCRVLFWLSPFVHLTLFSNSEKPCPCCPSYSHLFDPSLHVTNLLSPSPSPGPSLLLRLQPATLGYTLTAPHPSCLWTLLIPRPYLPVHVDAFLTSCALAPHAALSFCTDSFLTLLGL